MSSTKMDHHHVDDCEEVGPYDEKAEMLSCLRMYHDVWSPSRLLKEARTSGITPDLFDGELAFLVEYWTLYDDLERIISVDDKDEFASFVSKNHEKLEKLPPSEALEMICRHDAVTCAAALLDESQLQHLVDVKLKSVHAYYFPIEIAAAYLSVDMIDFLLERGADPNVHVDCSYLSPLNSTLCMLSKHELFRNWTPNDPFIKLVYLLCLPELEKPLHAIKVLSARTKVKHLEEICFTEISSGDFIRVAALLLAARDKLLHHPCEDLKSTPAGKYIFEQLQKFAEQKATCESSNSYDLKYKKVLVDAFSLVKSIWMASDFLDPCFPIKCETIPKNLPPYDIAYAIFNDQANVFQLPINVRDDNIECLLPNLNMEAEALSKRRSVSTSRTFNLLGIVNLQP